MKIREIILRTSQLAATTAFYTHTLQLPLLRESANSVSFQAGSSVLIFEQSDTIASPVYHVAFNIPQNRLPEAIQWLQGATTLLPVTGNSPISDFPHWNAHAVYFYDNNGNLLELIARHDLKNDAAKWQVECISELGIATATPTRYADELIRDYQLPVFSKQPRLEQFTALGDEEGLLIIVAEERNWYPTAIPARHFPASITIEYNGNVTTLSV